jgi:nascent polypeptide-associated complex subunit beta
VVGSSRRKKKVVAKASKQEDKKILSAVKKYNPRPMDGIVEANMFKDDNTVIHFEKPNGITHFLW